MAQQGNNPAGPVDPIMSILTGTATSIRRMEITGNPVKMVNGKMPGQLPGMVTVTRLPDLVSRKPVIKLQGLHNPKAGM